MMQNKCLDGPLPARFRGPLLRKASGGGKAYMDPSPTLYISTSVRGQKATISSDDRGPVGRTSTKHGRRENTEKVSVAPQPAFHIVAWEA